MAGLFDFLGGVANQITDGTGGSGGSDNPLLQLAQQFPGSEGGESGSTDNPPIWMGQTRRVGEQYVRTDPYEPGELVGGRTKYIGTNMSKVLQLPYQWDEKKRREVMARMQAAGYDVYTISDLAQAWEEVVGQAADSWQATDGQNPMTPWDILDSRTRDMQHYGLLDENGNPLDGSGPAEPTWQGEVDADGNWVTRSKTKTVDEVDDGDAWAIMQQAAQAALGREATDNEVRRFAYKANDVAARQPEITTTKTTLNSGEQNPMEQGNVISTETHSRGGFSSGDAQRMAAEMNETPEAAAYQAASTYYNAFIAALDSTVDL